MVELRIEQQKTRDAFQNLVNKGIDPATSAMEGFSKVVNRVVDMIPGTGSETTDKNKSSASNATEGTGGASTSSTSSANGPVDTKQIMAAIREHESGGNYQIQSKNSNATGAYQFLDDSWKSLTKKYGMGTEYAQAKLAPKDIQDAIAAKFIEEILKANNNDPRAVFNTWYTGNAKGIISKEAMAKNNNLTAEQMTNQFMDIYTRLQKQPSQANDKSSSNSSNATDTPKEAPMSGWQPPWLQTPAIRADNGADVMLSGPSTGYRPNVVMHETENLTITPKAQMASGGEISVAEINSSLQQQTAMFAEMVRIMGDQQGNDLVFQQLSMMEQLNRTTQDQVNISNKILQASR
jgi:hypothetical protein